jgi:hypothetical protein
LLDQVLLVSNSFQFPCETHLTSKTVLIGFIAAWFFAASPMRRSSEVKETKDGVVKLPCSLATGGYSVRCDSSCQTVQIPHTDLNASALVVGHTRVGGSLEIVSGPVRRVHADF